MLCFGPRNAVFAIFCGGKTTEEIYMHTSIGTVPLPHQKFYADFTVTLYVKDLERAKMKFCQTKEHKPASIFYNCTYMSKSPPLVR